jgi:hypothetical protein
LRNSFGAPPSTANSAPRPNIRPSREIAFSGYYGERAIADLTHGQIAGLVLKASAAIAAQNGTCYKWSDDPAAGAGEIIAAIVKKA